VRAHPRLRQGRLASGREGRVIRWSDFGDRFSRYGWEAVSRPRPGVLGRALSAKRLEAIHWRGLTQDALSVLIRSWVRKAAPAGAAFEETEKSLEPEKRES
jgi:hypothetical protein